MKKGKLFLIPSYISENTDPDFFSPYNLRIISGLDEFIVEELRTARRFLRLVNYTNDINLVNFQVLNEHTDPDAVEQLIKPLIRGKDAGLISESGTPCIADPGSLLVNLAHQRKIKVVPLTGPNSIILAIMASGLNGQSFTFHGYLPIDKTDRKKAIKALERDAQMTNRTQIFIETPYRNQNLFEAIISICSDELKLCIACNISSSNENIQSKTIAEWKLLKPDIHKKPAVFLVNFS